MLLTGCETKKQSEEVSEINSVPVAPVVAQTDEETAFNPDTDLPPAGTRSLFDYILKENGGLPFPFEKLLETISSYSKDGEAPLALLLPDARSLSKGEASFTNPRMVVAVNTRPMKSENDFGMHLKNRLFLGYIESVNQIEVISYNEGAGRFEFQLVDDYYEGGVPKVMYASRALCLSCHQNDAPIFPVRPWDETNVSMKVQQRILQARNIDPNRAKTSTFHGVPLLSTLQVAQEYDDLTNTASVIPITQKIWREGCGGNQPQSKECRRLMLQLGLRFAWDSGTFNPGTSHAGIIKSQAEQQLLAYQKNLWPTQGIPFPDADIANRDPFKEEENKGIIDTIKGWFSSKPEGANLSIEELEELSPELDPLTVRPYLKTLTYESSDGIFGIAQFFTYNDVNLLKKHSGYEFEKIVQILQTQKADILLKNQPFQRIATMKFLLKELGLSSLPHSCCETEEGMSPPLAQGVQPLLIAEGSNMVHFQQYCFACHRGNPASHLNFMSGDTEEDVWENIRNVPEIKEVLEWEKYQGTTAEANQMPPKDSFQYRKLLNAPEEVRTAMIESVPSLFSF